MNKQSGFILPSGLALYGIIGAAVVILGLTGAVWVQTSRLETRTVELKTKTDEYDKFVADVRAIGEAQELKTKEMEAKHAKIVKEKDDANLLAHANLAATAKRLRDTISAGSGLVPTAAPGASRPNLACYSRADLDTALRTFTGGVGEIVIQSESSTIDLNTAKEWAKEINNRKE